MAEDTSQEIKEEILNVEDETNSSAKVDESDINTQNLEGTKESEEIEIKEQKKVPILNKILFALVGLLLLVLITGIILFFMGFFDTAEEPKEREQIKQEKIVKEENSFNISDINSKKLNKQLLLLTNKNIIEEENNKREKLEEEKKIKLKEEKEKKEALALEEEKISKEKEELENKKIELEKQKVELETLKNEAIALRNEMIISKNLLEMQKDEVKIKEKDNLESNQEASEEENKEKDSMILNENKFVSLINVAKIKGNLYKSYLDKITAINSDIKLCRDELNRIEIYYGPFKDNSDRRSLYTKLQENGIVNSYEVELTKEEFNKRCNY